MTIHQVDGAESFPGFLTVQEALDEAYELKSISRMPARVKCAELAWRTLGALIE